MAQKPEIGQKVHCKYTDANGTWHHETLMVREIGDGSYWWDLRASYGPESAHTVYVGRDCWIPADLAPDPVRRTVGPMEAHQAQRTADPALRRLDENMRHVFGGQEPQPEPRPEPIESPTYEDMEAELVRIQTRASDVRGIVTELEKTAHKVIRGWRYAWAQIRNHPVKVVLERVDLISINWTTPPGGVKSHQIDLRHDGTPSDLTWVAECFLKDFADA